MFETADIISTYSRADAIADGVLVDLNVVHGDLIKEAGIIFPLAMTATCYAEWVKPNEAEISFGQSLEGRMWDVLHMFKYAVRQQREKSSVIMVNLMVTKVEGKLPRQRKAVIKAICGPGETAAPVITFMLPEED